MPCWKCRIRKRSVLSLTIPCELSGREEGRGLQIRILAPGKIREKHLQPAVEEYVKRLRKYARLEMVSVRENHLPPNLSAAAAQAVREKEARRLLEALRPGEFVIALEAGSQGTTSQDLARYLQNLQSRGRSQVAFVLGGPIGLAPGLRDRAEMVLSLSPLTFTTGLAHLVLLEQLYRCFRIIHGHPYHRQG